MKSNTLIQKFWNYCNTLRDDGVSHGEYLEQLTFLLFLKLAHEDALSSHPGSFRVPKGYDWASLRNKNGKPLTTHYSLLLSRLGTKPGVLGAIFHNAQCKIQDPAKLALLIRLLDDEDWATTSFDIKGELYEGLLQKTAEDTKSGAGQYFTPRPLIRTMVECLNPAPMKTIADPACGTGGFFLGAYSWLREKKLNKKQLNFLQTQTFHGNEIVPATLRLCLMNLFLHGIGSLDEEPAVVRSDALLSKPSQRYDYVLANPPFGKKSSITLTSEDGEEDHDALIHKRPDFWETTSNKQLGFLQHIAAMLSENGKAAVVLPDNVLFEGGAGERIRRKLLATYDVHTLLRLPTGIFYAQGVKANVLFFDAKAKSKAQQGSGLWIYDLRAGMNFSLKAKPLESGDLADFILCFNASNRHNRKSTDRFRYFHYEDLVARDRANLDISWLKNEGVESASTLPMPDVLQREIIEHLETALGVFRSVAEALPSAKRRGP
ncbi:SAM-dependent DNA methyltransferase [Corallococcus exercitus]|uniref:class I SAM-dependent DNA methyltransferase n=1 Tax=Corallococcus exercitus TaxID=2316736 RepID=UPI000EA10CB3|nr:class I SAM-dependent DNA methyltransferase [Corallococcus exercitus]RKG80917.1 SAM-dependent DNA methyltransferase [Corallococcus exercitus]